MKKKKNLIDIYYQELLDAIHNNTEVGWQEESILKALKIYLAALNCHFDSKVQEMLKSKEVIKYESIGTD